MRERLFLYITAFTGGMSVMAVELAATRLLAPYFGTSMVVWTIVIGLIMIFLSIGNLLGGRLADRSENLSPLFRRLFFAATWLALIPFVGKYIIVALVFGLMWVLPKSLLVAGSVLACIFVFGPPLVMLGMNTPFIVRHGVKDLSSAGTTAGRIYSLSTAGSIIGTFLPTFATIPYLGTGKTFLSFSFLLYLLCLGHAFLSGSRHKKAPAAIAALLILTLMLSPWSDRYAFWKETVKESDSLYNYLQVSREGDSVFLSTNVAFGVQSVYRPDTTLTGFYYDYALAAPMFSQRYRGNAPLDALVLGLGTGTFAKQLVQRYPGSHVDGVEIDDRIAEYAHTYFDLKPEEANVIINDGRTFVNTCEKNYDVILVDAYHDITIPFHMSTKEFFTRVRKLLKPGGVLVLNINMRSRQDGDLADWIADTTRSVFSEVRTFNAPHITNEVVYAWDGYDGDSQFRENLSRLDRSDAFLPLFTEVSEQNRKHQTTRKLLTDNLAPVEILGQRQIDQLVSDGIADLKSQLGGGKKLMDLLQ